MNGMVESFTKGEGFEEWRKDISWLIEIRAESEGSYTCSQENAITDSLQVERTIKLQVPSISNTK